MIRIKVIKVLVPEAYLDGIDELIKAKMYYSRADLVRNALRDLLKEELWHVPNVDNST